MRSLREWLATVLLGQKCPLGCNYREHTRGHKSFDAHLSFDHAGDKSHA